MPWLLILVWLAGCDRAASDAPPAMGTIERDRIALSAESSEPILRVAVAEGDRVAAGDLLVVQDPAMAQAALARDEAVRDQAAARLELAVTGPRRQEIAQGRARVAAARSAAETARLELERERDLLARNFTTQNRVDVLEGRFEEAAARLAEAEAALDALVEGTRSEEVVSARNALAAAEARVTRSKLALARTKVYAPVAATVEALPFETGERPPAGATVAVLRAQMMPYARVYVPEPLRTRLTPGAPAEVWVDGYEQPFEARLRFIATEASFTPFFALTEYDRSRLSYVAEVDLIDPRASALPSGIPAEVRFIFDDDGE